MRNRFKAIITIMVAIFVISSISFIVSAATQVDAGSVTTAKGSYTWEYFDDDTLIIRPDTYKTTIIIDKDDLPHIFERFYKGKNADENSVGIGLSMSKSIIEKCGGYIKVVSAPDKGTTFIIKFFKL